MKLLIVEFVLFLKLCGAVIPQLGERCNLIDAGGEAYCKLFDDCPMANELHTKNGQLPQACRPHNNDLVVCCSGAITNPAVLPVSKSLAKCQEYSSNIICNMKPLSSLPENNILTIKNFPHAAKLLYRNETTNRLFAFSDEGTLISARYVVTVASSLNRYSGYTAVAKIRLAWIGVKRNHDSLTNETFNRPVYYDVEKTIAHPNYQSSIYNNIALIKLSKKVEFSEYVRPICLPDTNTTWPNEVYRVYYNLNYPNNTQRPLVKYQRRLEPNDVCHVAYNGYPGYLQQDDNFICTTSIEINDSTYPYIVDGAPIVTSHPSIPCSNVLLGVSLTKLQRRVSAYSINIYNYREWIEDIIWADGEE